MKELQDRDTQQVSKRLTEDFRELIKLVPPTHAWTQPWSLEEATDVNGWNLAMLDSTVLMSNFSIFFVVNFWDHLALARNR